MSQIQTVKDASDIVEIIGERVELQRAGSNLKAPCPFHSEKTPSFFVSESIQRYRCFGCGETGDVFSFLERYEGMTFVEALRYLADRAGIELESYSVSHEDEQRDRLRAILDLTKDYYHFLLTKHELGAPAREYLAQRGISQESIKIFQLGYSLDTWDGLISYLHQKKKYQLKDLDAAGLIIKGKGGRWYDRFRGRLMFPLTDKRGQVVGFSGRVLDPEVKEAKYINSPETSLYHKSELLYGYSQLFQEIRKKDHVIVVEGELDVISSSQAHVNNVVALKGSALTREQAQLLRRTVDRVVLALDSDAAGIEATKRAIPIAQEFDLELRVLSLAGGKDPDDLARKQPDAWRELAKTSLSVYQFFIDSAFKQNDPATPEGKRQIINELAPIIGIIKHAVEKDFYLKKIAEGLQVSADLVRKDVEQFKDAKRLGTSPRRAPQPKSPPPKPRRHQLEELIWFLALRVPELQTDQSWRHYLRQIESIDWVEPRFPNLLAALEQHAATNQDLSGFTPTLAGDLQQLVSQVYLHPEYVPMLEDIKFEEFWQQTLNHLQKEITQQEIAQLTQRLDQLDHQPSKTADEDAEQRQLLSQIIKLRRQIDH